MTTKEEMLGRIRSALSDVRSHPPVEPPKPEVWNLEGLSLDEMATRFSENLVAVKGKIVRCESFDEAVIRIKVMLKEIDAHKIAVLDRPLCRSVAEKLDGKEIVYASDSETKTEHSRTVSVESLSTADAGLVSPEFLLADTGSCLFKAPIAFDRLTTYITPVSLVVADRSMLREHLPAAWAEITSKLLEARTGEFVIVTGPSRTADIEKILILGVHGPKQLVVFLID